MLKLNHSQLAKLEKSVPLSCHCHEIYKVEAVSQKNFNNNFKNYDFYEYVKFGVISLEIDILSINASIKFESENSFAHILFI